ncbi:Sodium, potassium, lithium and rubidium/H(+) antiporter [Hartmannibacter diazotrophicus]|uniref:Sodium, potassium, lithium and rubidium/H(+) antiporter n=1 Tax=Hartmannibacter diazotrophicus TaxID=1482074 RepID=A0A2C9DAB8_9HYPH|nr:Na+/H+ antiporter [Hartmannibacter diazotrophicus]SON57274.1 Sodium, potassium, lithium and rubidium/H(+) antiporter [Hartmannibacter diazotrophicus]
MDIVTNSLVLLAAVVLSAGLGRAPGLAMPRPLVQIALGAAIAAVAPLGFTLNPDVFFLLFLPPLLFLDGWRIPKAGLRRDRGTIVALAFGLVFFTVFGLGVFVHAILPAVPLSVAFALAAAVSPTDPVAVTAIAQRVPVPPRLLAILEGEALLNDASGLVAMRFAVAAAMTDPVSLSRAGLGFLWLVVGGLGIGFCLTWAVVGLKNQVSRRLGEEADAQILISLLLPFGAYLIADRIGASAILAAVAAGLAMSRAEQSGKALPLTRIRRAAVWTTIGFAANGVMFVLLGEQLPELVENASATMRSLDHRSPIWLLVYVIAIGIALTALRFLWVWASLRLVLFRARNGLGAAHVPGLRLVAATALAGVRGAVTLAGILTLPLSDATGAPFPGRNLVVLIAAGLILMSLIAASVGLPLLLRGLALPAAAEDEGEAAARLAAARDAIAAVIRTRDGHASVEGGPGFHTAAAEPVLSFYERRIAGLTAGIPGASDHVSRLEHAFWLAAIRAERRTIYECARAGRLSDSLARQMVRELDLVELRLADSDDLNRPGIAGGRLS